jgi:hypothetical protein
MKVSFLKFKRRESCTYMYFYQYSRLCYQTSQVTICTSQLAHLTYLQILKI